MKGLLVHPVEWEHLCGISKAPKGLKKFPIWFEIFILDSKVDARGDFIQREVFQALLEEKISQSWGINGTFRSLRLQSTAEIYLAHDHKRSVYNALVMRVS